MVMPNSVKKRGGRLVNVILALALIVGVCLIVGGGWAYYQHLQDMERYRQEVEAANRDNATPEQHQAAEGKDEEEKTDALANYQVAPTHPRAIYIDKINVRGRVIALGLNPDQSIQSTVNIFDTSWYTGSSKPGEPGVSLISGHASGPSREGLFAYIDTLVAGDKVTVERGDGTKLVYEVERKIEQPLESVDMSQILSAEDNEDRLNIMTCSGEWLKDMTTFNKRTIIFTRRVS